jgi:RNA-splicing ligase RtcB
VTISLVASGGGEGCVRSGGTVVGDINDFVRMMRAPLDGKEAQCQQKPLVYLTFCFLFSPP